MTVNSTELTPLTPLILSDISLSQGERACARSRLPQLLPPLTVPSSLEILRWVELSSMSRLGWGSGVFSFPDREKEEFGVAGYLITL